ncbi:MAG: pyruvate ferredoxin oxidoreductase, partial [Eubacteriales bacterium]|nr:pyruvate ferredoxin oxidoreductase [Eubacteriales bacterium]
WTWYEVIDGKYVVNYKQKNKLPVEDYLKVQGRYKHLFTAENKHLIGLIQQEVDARWERLLKLEEHCSRQA